ncbi:MAG: hypothetical protein R3E01_05170 [Pirellulaceae bacterium]|nr:hypothetical protein [Planctomycetales bacterium]
MGLQYIPNILRNQRYTGQPTSGEQHSVDLMTRRGLLPASASEVDEREQPRDGTRRTVKVVGAARHDTRIIAQRTGSDTGPSTFEHAWDGPAVRCARAMQQLGTRVSLRVMVGKDGVGKQITQLACEFASFDTYQCLDRTWQQVSIANHDASPREIACYNNRPSLTSNPITPAISHELSTADTVIVFADGANLTAALHSVLAAGSATVLVTSDDPATLAATELNRFMQNASVTILSDQQFSLITDCVDDLHNDRDYRDAYVAPDRLPESRDQFAAARVKDIDRARLAGYFATYWTNGMAKHEAMQLGAQRAIQSIANRGR